MRFSRFAGTLSVSLALCAMLPAQTLLGTHDARRLDQLFLEQSSDKELKCQADVIKPFLDFSFRLETGFAFACPLRLFDGKETVLVSAIRTVSETGEQHTFAEKIVVPSAPRPQPGQRPVNLQKVQSQIMASTGFIVGEGKYRLEFALVDPQERVFREHWDVKAELKGKDKEVQIAQSPNHVSLLRPHLWNGKLQERGSGLRVTVLLDAAPANPFATSLRQWDRILLLDSVSSLLRNLPCESVRLAVFSLEQQREIFLSRDLKGTDMPKLARQLRELELGTVSVTTLRQSEGWARVLSDVTRREIQEPEPSDAVIFIGPSVRFSSKTAQQMIPEGRQHRPRFFYFEYYPPSRRTSRFPDAIEHMVDYLDGETFHISSPGELAAAIHSVQGQLARSGDQRVRAIED